MNETRTFKQMLRSILALIMVAAMAFGCVAMLSGCQSGTSNGDEEDENGKKPSNKNDWYSENMSDEEYMQGLYMNSIEGFVSGLTEVYGALGSFNPNASMEMNSNVSVSVQVGDMVIDMLEESYSNSTGDLMDFGFLSRIGLDLSLASNGDLMKNEIALMLSGKKIATVSMLMNMANGVAYLAIPELNDTYIKADMGELGMGSASVIGSASQITELMAMLPSEELLNTLINRYVELVLKNLKHVERETITLESDGLKQSVTELSVKIYEEDAHAVMMAVLSTALEDQDLKKAVEGLSEMAGYDVYSELKEEMEYLLEDLESVDTDDFDTENFFELITYTDAQHNIIGARLNLSDLGLVYGDIYYYTVTEGNTFAFEAVVEEADFAVIGSGTNKSGTIDAEYTLIIDGSEYVILELEDWKATADSVKGTIRIEPTAELLDKMFGGSSGLPFADIALEIKLKNNGLELNLVGNDALIIGIVFETEDASGGTIREPSNYVDATNSAQLQQWLEGMKFDTIFRNLRNAGVPSDLVDMLESELNSSMNGGYYAEPDWDY